VLNHWQVLLHQGWEPQHAAGLQLPALLLLLLLLLLRCWLLVLWELAALLPVLLLPRPQETAGGSAHLALQLLLLLARHQLSQGAAWWPCAVCGGGWGACVC
jgi:hypothetical protein